MATVIILAAGTMLVPAVFMVYVLGWANKAFHVEVDPRQEAIAGALPGANCGGCGFIGCNEYAEAIVAGQVGIDKCSVGGSATAARIAEILGIEHEEVAPKRAVVHCGAHWQDRLGRSDYRGERTCAAAALVAGVQGCTYGCLGYGDCVTACKFDAIHIVDGLATVDYEKCVGCGACVGACPKNIISLVSFKADRMLTVACSNRDFGKDVKAVCKVGCTGCKLCQKLSDGLLSVADNIASADYEAYNPAEMAGADAAAAKCPAKCLVMRGRGN